MPLYLIRYGLPLVALLAVLLWVDRHRHSVDQASHEAYIASRDLRDLRAVDAAKAAAKATHEAVEANNAVILRKFTDAQDNLANTQRDLDLARRLLARAVAGAAAGRPVPEAGSGPAVAQASGAGGDGSLTSAIAAAAGECRRNADRLDSLIAEIEPQVF